VKRLFKDDENLKESMHYGPDMRVEGGSNDFLKGFGREIYASCIPEQ
jgi:hypothetical protein